jgi:hypothetical protein
LGWRMMTWCTVWFCTPYCGYQAHSCCWQYIPETLSKITRYNSENTCSCNRARRHHAT